MKRLLSTKIFYLIIIRIVLHTPVRMIYPFLAIFEGAFGVSTQAISLALTTRLASGGLVPLWGSLADNKGRKAAMLAGLALFTLGVGLLSAWPTFTAFFFMLLLTYTGGMIFMPSLQAYLGDIIPYRERGAILGLSELGWSLSFILGVPAMGWVIARQGWHAPFPILTGLGILGLLLAAAVLPADPAQKTQKQGLWETVRLILQTPTTRAGVIICMSFAAANELVNLVFGLWLYDSFQVKIAALAAASAVIGLAELGGEIGVSTLVDKLGKTRSVGIGLVLNALATLALPLLGKNLAGAMFGLFLIYLTFEFTIVSTIPLMTELLPQARATLVASSSASIAVGRALGTLIAPSLYLINRDMSAGPRLSTITILAATLCLVALGFLRVLKGK